MKKSNWAMFIALAFLIVSVSCSLPSTPIPPTSTPSPMPPTVTPNPTETAKLIPSPTLVSTAEQTATLIPSPTLESTMEPTATATAQAVTLDCRNSINNPANVDWRTKKCDTFSTDNGDWLTEERDNDLATYSKRIKSGKYQIEITSKKSMFTYSTISAEFSDFLVTMTTDVDCEKDCASGIVFRHSDIGKYIFVVDPYDQAYKIAYLLDGEWVKIIDWTTSSLINKNGTNQLTVLSKGTEYIVYINDDEVNQFSDDAITSGKVGFATNIRDENVHATIYFDNFLLLAP
jgi:hypothetical protein